MCIVDFVLHVIIDPFGNARGLQTMPDCHEYNDESNEDNRLAHLNR